MVCPTLEKTRSALIVSSSFLAVSPNVVMFFLWCLYINVDLDFICWKDSSAVADCSDFWHPLCTWRATFDVLRDVTLTNLCLSNTGNCDLRYLQIDWGWTLRNGIYKAGHYIEDLHLCIARRVIVGAFPGLEAQWVAWDLGLILDMELWIYPWRSMPVPFGDRGFTRSLR